MIGRKLGHYEITAALGAGGMGEVFRARDTKLNRDVALKVLPAAFAQDAERLARFRREAHLLAALNDPHIAAIHGLEESDGVVALALELAPGEDLTTRIARGPIPVDEALVIAKQIAEGLESAHEQGIVHRDLKPANIKVGPDGRVKILDFGLAKAWEGDAGAPSDVSRSPTITRGTEAGVILGTAAYMSPEQARGKPVDKRADIWAFGVVLYEMLTGRRLFEGETVSDVLAAVLKTEPDWTQLPDSVPPGIRRLVERCLQKDPRRRLRDIGDARLALDDAASGEPAPPPARQRTPGGRMVPWLLSAALFVALLATWATRPRRAPAEVPHRQFSIDLPWHSVPNWTDFEAALAPDGSRIAYFGRRPNDNDVDVLVRPLDGLDAAPLADARESAGLAFSPDGEWIALLDPHGLRKVSVRGGRAQSLARIDYGDGLSWGGDGTILVGHSSGLQRVPAGGGPAQPVTRIDAAAGETAHLEPRHLPGGRRALMTVLRGEQLHLAVADLERGTHRVLPLSGFGAAYSSASGHLVFRQGGSVLAVAFDPETGTASGDAVPVLENVRRGPYLAADGTMVYVPDRAATGGRLVWVDRTGRVVPVPGERLAYSHLSLDASGTQALLNISGDVHVRDIEGGTRRLLASGGGLFPIWSRDGRWATYAATVDGKRVIVRRPVDDSAAAEILATGRELLVPTSWNGRTGDLAYFDDASDIWILPPGGPARRLIATAFNERSGRFSPDGRWLAYVSDETGTYQVYVVPYPGPGAKLAVSVSGGLEPIWSSDGTELYFRRGGRVLAARMTFAPRLAASVPVELFDGPYTLDLMGHQRWDAAPDGRFLMVEDGEDYGIVVVQAWPAALERLAPGGKGR